MTTLNFFFVSEITSGLSRLATVEHIVTQKVFPLACVGTAFLPMQFHLLSSWAYPEYMTVPSIYLFLEEA